MWFTRKWYDTGKCGYTLEHKANGFRKYRYYEEEAHIEKTGKRRWVFSGYWEIVGPDGARHGSVPWGGGLRYLGGEKLTVNTGVVQKLQPL